MIAPEQEKQDQQHDECRGFEESDGEQALIAQHVVLPPNPNRHSRKNLARAGS
jgi:hypothetical protein